MKFRKGNFFAGLTVLVLIATILLGFYVTMWPFAKIYGTYMEDTDFIAKYTTEESCIDHGYWNGAECHQLPDRAKTLMVRARYAWLVAPIIFIVGLFIWYIVVVTRRDPQFYKL